MLPDFLVAADPEVSDDEADQKTHVPIAASASHMSKPSAEIPQDLSVPPCAPKKPNNVLPKDLATGSGENRSGTKALHFDPDGPWNQEGFVWLLDCCNTFLNKICKSYAEFSSPPYPTERLNVTIFHNENDLWTNLVNEADFGSEKPLRAMFQDYEVMHSSPDPEYLVAPRHDAWPQELLDQTGQIEGIRHCGSNLRSPWLENRDFFKAFPRLHTFLSLTELVAVPPFWYPDHLIALNLTLRAEKTFSETITSPFEAYTNLRALELRLKQKCSPSTPGHSLQPLTHLKKLQALKLTLENFVATDYKSDLECVVHNNKGLKAFHFSLGLHDAANNDGGLDHVLRHPFTRLSLRNYDIQSFAAINAKRLEDLRIYNSLKAVNEGFVAKPPVLQRFCFQQTYVEPDVLRTLPLASLTHLEVTHPSDISMLRETALEYFSILGNSNQMGDLTCLENLDCVPLERMSHLALWINQSDTVFLERAYAKKPALRDKVKTIF